jgi:hypothetical protein
MENKQQSTLNRPDGDPSGDHAVISEVPQEMFFVVGGGRVVTSNFHSLDGWVKTARHAVSTRHGAIAYVLRFFRALAD